jgi:hypothetical protein
MSMDVTLEPVKLAGMHWYMAKDAILQLHNTEDLAEVLPILLNRILIMVALCGSNPVTLLGHRAALAGSLAGIPSLYPPLAHCKNTRQV